MVEHTLGGVGDIVNAGRAPAGSAVGGGGPSAPPGARLNLNSALPPLASFGAAAAAVSGRADRISIEERRARDAAWHRARRAQLSAQANILAAARARNVAQKRAQGARAAARAAAERACSAPGRLSGDSGASSSRGLALAARAVGIRTGGLSGSLLRTVPEGEVAPALGIGDAAPGGSGLPRGALPLPKGPPAAHPELPRPSGTRSEEIFRGEEQFIPELSNVGQMTGVCTHCLALHWLDERSARSSEQTPSFSSCCANGQVAPPVVPDPPEPLRT